MTMRLPPAQLADSVRDVLAETDRLLRHARTLHRQTKRLAPDVHLLPEDVHAMAGAAARANAAKAALAAERVLPIAVQILEQHPHPGLIRIGVRFVLLGLAEWIRG